MTATATGRISHDANNMLPVAIGKGCPCATVGVAWLTRNAGVGLKGAVRKLEPTMTAVTAKGGAGVPTGSAHVPIEVLSGAAAVTVGVGANTAVWFGEPARLGAGVVSPGTVSVLAGTNKTPVTTDRWSMTLTAKKIVSSPKSADVVHVAPVGALAYRLGAFSIAPMAEGAGSADDGPTPPWIAVAMTTGAVTRLTLAAVIAAFFKVYIKGAIEVQR
jgi:hypothetical protein